MPKHWARGRLAQVARHMADRWLGALGIVDPISKGKATQIFIRRHGAGLYAPAYKSLAHSPLTSEDAKVKLFLKAEKWAKPEGTVLKTPRAIQYRGPRYNICLGAYLIPLEERLYAHMCDPDAGPGPYTSKGLTPHGRAALVARLWARYPRPCAAKLDHSRWDAHSQVPILEAEHLVYATLCGGNRRFLQWLLSLQLRNEGRGAQGVRYSLRGGRMSGDYNTALGNTIGNAVVLTTCVVGYEVSILVEGDDGLIFGNVEDIEVLAKHLPGRCEDLGFELKIGVARHLEEIDFCSTGVVEHEGGFMSVRDWPRPFITDCWTPKPVAPTSVPAKAYTTAVGFWHLYKGIPVYQAWAEYLLSHCAPAELDPWYQRDWWGRVLLAAKDEPPKTISAMLRASFALRTGVEPSAQLRLEERLRRERGPWPITPGPRELPLQE